MTLNQLIKSYGPEFEDVLHRCRIEYSRFHPEHTPHYADWTEATFPLRWEIVPIYSDVPPGCGVCGSGQTLEIAIIQFHESWLEYKARNTD